MPQYTLSQLAAAIGGQIFENGDVSIQHLLTDSRGVAYPAESLFFAIKGVRHDGHRYLADLYQIGVRAFVVEQLPALENFKGAGFVKVDNSLHALQAIAIWHRAKFRIPVVGITGSNGKTIVKEWIYQTLHSLRHVVRSPKSYNSQIGVPLSIWQMDSKYDIAIIEAGISEMGEMARLEPIIRPNIGIITNIGEPHQENFLDYRQKCKEKLQLFAHCQSIIYCKDHALIHELLQAPEYTSIQKLSWSTQLSADLSVSSISKEKNQTTIAAQYINTPIQYTLPFVDYASIENSLHVATLLFSLGVDANEISLQLSQLSPVAMRLELKQGINGCTLINDAYNSDLGSLSIALDALCSQNQHRRKTVILSDILQSGKQSRELYSEVNHLLLQKNISKLYCIGNEISANKELFSIPADFYPNTEQFLKTFRRESFVNEAILLKGSRSFTFEHILKVLEEKAHETVLEVNLNAMIHNLNYFRSKLNTGTKLIAMVKAFSYGSGTFEIANILQHQRVDYLAVAFADEGVALREAGIAMPIMVMNPEQTTFDQIITYRLEPEIFSFNVLQQFAEAVEKAGETRYPVHLKLDTGMHRLGFMEHDLNMLIDTLQHTESIQPKSIFSHLAGADEAQFDDFTREQIAVFEHMSETIRTAFPYYIARHILNSAGIERFANAQFDMVRLGIGLYGISAIDPANVRQVSRLKTVILQIKQIPQNETVGYSRRFKAQSLTTIGIVPIGYADGLHRSLGNGVGKMWVNGKLASIIGSICMDMCMLDLTDIEAIEGDDVIVFGDEYPVTEVAELMKSIPYEVLTSISRRVKRVYYQE